MTLHDGGLLASVVRSSWIICFLRSFIRIESVHSTKFLSLDFETNFSVFFQVFATKADEDEGEGRGEENIRR